MNGEPSAVSDPTDRNSEQEGQHSAWRAPAITLGPSVLVVLYVIVDTLSTIIGVLSRQESKGRRFLRVPLVGGALLPWAYLLFARPWHLSWGTTEGETRRPLPYDHFAGLMAGRGC